MDWYDEVLGRLKELEVINALRDKNSGSFIKINSIDDLNAVDIKQITSLSIAGNYQGDLPDLSGFINLISFSCFCTASWDYYSEAPIGLKSLYMTVDKCDKPIALEFDMLENLSIYVNGYDYDEVYEGEKDFYDFTGCETITVLEIKHWINLDFSSISYLRNLRKLSIAYCDVRELSWIGGQSFLEYFVCVNSNVEFLDGIQNLSELKYLDLSYNKISDILPIESLSNLQTLNLFHNNIENEGYIRSNGIEKFTITEKDRDINRLCGSVNGIVNEAAMYINHQNLLKEDDMPLYVRKFMQRPLRDRFESIIQSKFENTIHMINPLDFYDYELSYKKMYISYALKRFPFLEMDSEITKMVKSEEDRYLGKSNFDSGNVVFIYGDVYVINVDCKLGTGNIDIEGNCYISEKRDKVIKQIKKHWKMISLLIPFNFYDVRIHISNFYGRGYEEEITLAVLIAIKNKIDNKRFPDNIAIACYISKQGKLSGDAVGRRTIHMAEINGIKNIVAYDGNSEDLLADTGKVNVLYFKKLEEVFGWLEDENAVADMNK